MDKALSTEEVSCIAGGNVTMIPYTDVHLYNDINDLFATDKVLINYLSKKNFGHWVGLHKKDNVITFFDSYGDIPDDQIQFIPKKYRIESMQDFPYLIKLMKKWKDEKPGREIHFNDEQFQRYSEKIQTCGRWVGLFLRYANDYLIEDFIHIMNEVKDESIKKLGLRGIQKDLFFDELVTRVTDDLLK